MNGESAARVRWGVFPGRVSLSRTIGRPTPTPRRERRRVFRRKLRLLRLAQRQLDREPRPAVTFAIDLDRAAVGGDDRRRAAV